MKNIISQEWLLKNMLNENLVILDARAGLSDPKEGIRAYEEGHIPGAQFVSMEKVMTGELEEHNGRHPLPLLDTFIEDMKRFGVEDSSTVIIYDDGDLAMAGRLWWLLRYIGKKDVFLLEGGVNNWKVKGLELTKEIKKPKLSKILSLNIDKSIITDIEDIKNAINDDSVAIVDSRSYVRYSGQEEPLDRIPGHIPSAINFPWTDVVVDGVIMDMETLKIHYRDLLNYDEIIVHCGSGITGTVNFLFMEEIGIKSKLFPGGYSEWSSYLDNPVD